MMNNVMTHAEEEFWDLCETIVERVYSTLGSRLGSEEIVRLASELGVAIILGFAESENPQPEMAFQIGGRILPDPGNCWCWRRMALGELMEEVLLHLQ
jgi:hypothetical protein